MCIVFVIYNLFCCCIDYSLFYQLESKSVAKNHRSNHTQNIPSKLFVFCICMQIWFVNNPFHKKYIFPFLFPYFLRIDILVGAFIKPPQLFSFLLFDILKRLFDYSIQQHKDQQGLLNFQNNFILKVSPIRLHSITTGHLASFQNGFDRDETYIGMSQEKRKGLLCQTIPVSCTTKFSVTSMKEGTFTHGGHQRMNRRHFGSRHNNMKSSINNTFLNNILSMHTNILSRRRDCANERLIISP